MKIGLLGLGFMGQQHLAGYAALPDVTVMTRESPQYADIPPGDRASLQQTMLNDPEIEAIDICLPTPMHLPLVIAALEAGKHVVCEKPMALSESDCSEMMRAAEHSGRVLMIAHVLRFFPAYRILAEAVHSARYGAVEFVRFTRVSGEPKWADWLLDAEQSGGAVLDLLVHDFDQANTLFGLPAQACAHNTESENALTCTLEYNDSANGNLKVEIAGGWFRDGRPFGMGFYARFAEADLSFVNDHVYVQSKDSQRQELPLPQCDPYAEELRYFLDCCRNNQSPGDCPPVASARAVQMALKIQELARTAPQEFRNMNWE